MITLSLGVTVHPMGDSTLEIDFPLFPKGVEAGKLNTDPIFGGSGQKCLIVFSVF
jgi:hypothetical protein